MASHSSATVREHTSHSTRTTRTATIVDALKQRARSVLNDESIDAQTRAIIRCALKTNDPWLAELVRRADAGEDVFDNRQSLETNEKDEKIAALTEIICRAGDETTAALLFSWENFKTPRIPKCWRTPRSTSPLLAVVS